MPWTTGQNADIISSQNCKTKLKDLDHRIFKHHCMIYRHLMPSRLGLQVAKFNMFRVKISTLWTKSFTGLIEYQIFLWTNYFVKVFKSGIGRLSFWKSLKTFPKIWNIFFQTGEGVKDVKAPIYQMDNFVQIYGWFFFFQGRWGSTFNTIFGKWSKFLHIFHWMASLFHILWIGMVVKGKYCHCTTIINNDKALKVEKETMGPTSSWAPPSQS